MRFILLIVTCEILSYAAGRYATMYNTGDCLHSVLLLLMRTDYGAIERRP